MLDNDQSKRSTHEQVSNYKGLQTEYGKKRGMAEAPFSHLWLNSPEFSLRKPVALLLQRKYMDGWVLCYQVNTNRSHVLDTMSELASRVIDFLTC